MSCLFDSVAALLCDRPYLVRHSPFDELRAMPWPPTGRALRGAVCALLTAAALNVHDIRLDAWGAMETGTSSREYVSRMRDEGTWGGGVEIVALAEALRVPIEVSGAASAVFGEPHGPLRLEGPMRPIMQIRPLRLHYTGSHYTPIS